MEFTVHIEVFRFGDHTVSICVPDAADLRRRFTEGREKAVPFWGSVWPSARGLCEYLSRNVALYRGKQVMEAGAGLGLPAFFVAGEAARVDVSDIAAEATTVMRMTREKEGYANVDVQEANWSHLPDVLSAGLVLLSDVNYDPADFPLLAAKIRGWITGGAVILLSTPHRLMARDFLVSLEVFVTERTEVIVQEGGRAIVIGIIRLESPERQGPGGDSGKD